MADDRPTCLEVCLATRHLAAAAGALSFSLGWTRESEFKTQSTFSPSWKPNKGSRHQEEGRKRTESRMNLSMHFYYYLSSCYPAEIAACCLSTFKGTGLTVAQSATRLRAVSSKSTRLARATARSANSSVLILLVLTRLRCWMSRVGQWSAAGDRRNREFTRSVSLLSRVQVAIRHE